MSGPPCLGAVRVVWCVYVRVWGPLQAVLQPQELGPRCATRAVPMPAALTQCSNNPRLRPLQDSEEEHEGRQGASAPRATAAQQGAPAAQHMQDSHSEGEDEQQRQDEGQRERRQDEAQQERRHEGRQQPSGGGRGGGRGRGGRGRDAGCGRGHGGSAQHKPQSRLQRIAAEVQERKVGAAATPPAGQATPAAGAVRCRGARRAWHNGLSGGK